MKTLVVLAALAAVATAGPISRGDTDLDFTKIKRSPSLHHHHIATPVLVTPVHHTYVQPVIPHHLGLKKPIHHHHHFRSDDEKLETHSAESKESESKTKCMKQMEAKCEDDVIAKSSELERLKIPGDVLVNPKIVKSLMEAQAAVDMLRNELESSHNHSKSTTVPAKLESESDRRMHADVEAAKIALERMQALMANVESMNVHARQFKNSEVHDVNLELKSDEERLSQWKGALEDIEKNVELVRNIEDSFQNNDNSEKSGAFAKSSSFNHEMKEEHKLDEHHSGLSEKSAKLEKSSNLKHEMIEDHKLDAMQSEDHKLDATQSGNFEKSAVLDTTVGFNHELNNGPKHDSLSLKKEKTADATMARNMDTQTAHKHEMSSKSDMESSASSLSESKTSLDNTNEKNLGETSNTATALKLTAEHDHVKGFKNDEHSLKITEDEKVNKLVSHPSLKSSETLDMTSTHFEQENMAPVVDTTNFMKSAEQSQLVKHNKNVHHGAEGLLAHLEHGVNTHSSFQHASQKEHEMIPHMHHTSVPGQNAQAMNQHHDHHRSESLKSDQMTGQSQQNAVAVKATPGSGHIEKLQPSHGKSAEEGLFSIDMPAFKESLVPTIGSKSWKALHSARGAYGSGLSLGGSYGTGYSSGAGAVGVFPNARVGGCAIPLLLSCSPSVVTGSLAKGHGYAAPSYAASAYRGDNTNTHSKRDIMTISRPYKRNPNKDLQQKTVLN